MPMDATALGGLCKSLQTPARNEWQRLAMLQRKIEGRLTSTWTPDNADLEYKDQLLSLLTHHEVDIITFTSSSTVHNLMKLLDGKNELLEGVALACIGPITADTCRSYGLVPHIVSDVYTIDGLVEAIEKNPEKY